MTSDAEILQLTLDLCSYRTGVVAPGNSDYFARLGDELDFTLREYASGEDLNGWTVPDSWAVKSAEVRCGNDVLYDAAAHPLGVAAFSLPFQGELTWDELRSHVVTSTEQPDAIVYHCMWQYRPWNADWAISIPHRAMEDWDTGRTYEVDLVTEREPGSMLVAEYRHAGELDATIVFNAHTCHPGQANDGQVGVATLIRLFQSLQGRQTRYSYRLILGPEHLGTVFYLGSLAPEEIESLVGCVFCEMTGVDAPLRAASTFLGGHELDAAVLCAARSAGAELVNVPWRQGAGNDETVWEAPGWEVPCVELTRCCDTMAPFPEYHTSLDTVESLHGERVDQMYRSLTKLIDVVESNATMRRRFDGLVCLSNPRYDLYKERPDPAVNKELAEDSETWGYLLDCLLRYFDGKMTILDIAERHGVEFSELLDYLREFEAKGLITMDFVPIHRRPLSSRA